MSGMVGGGVRSRCWRGTSEGRSKRSSVPALGQSIPTHLTRYRGSTSISLCGRITTTWSGGRFALVQIPLRTGGPSTAKAGYLVASDEQPRFVGEATWGSARFPPCLRCKTLMPGRRFWSGEGQEETDPDRFVRPSSPATLPGVEWLRGRTDSRFMSVKEVMPGNEEASWRGPMASGNCHRKRKEELCYRERGLSF